MKKTREIIEIDDRDIVQELFGELDKNIRYIEREMGCRISATDRGLSISGERDLVEMTRDLINGLMETVEKDSHISHQQIRYQVDLAKKKESDRISEILDQVICLTAQGKPLRPKTLGQKKYIDSIAENDIVFGIGPAGTGKTYLAMAMAVTAYKDKEVQRIVLTRPAVEAGESLGFLPGDLQNKVDPYLRPLYDALYEIMGYDNAQKLMEKNTIEVAPLAYMRGRTLDNSYIILDEAQNTTPEQMKMFLTRLGFGSKAIITGDITQVDLPRGKKSGLIQVMDILKGVRGLDFVELSSSDVVRHPLVQRIIDAYDKYEGKND